MKIYHYNHIGKRKRQEDALAISEDNNLFVLCDGVGGSEDGQFASSFACAALIDLYNANSIKNLDDLKTIILRMSEQLTRVTDRYVATTLTVLYFYFDTAYLIHLGDSRIYYFNSSEQILKRTKDHSLVRELFDAGILTTEDEMKNHPLKSTITKSLSSKEILVPEDIDSKIIEHVSPGDLFLLCSDGVLEVFNDCMLKNIFTKKDQFYNLGESIKEKTIHNSKDNNSAILLEYDI